MSQSTRRGYQPKDLQQFNEEAVSLLQKAADEVAYLLERGYPIKPLTTFVGNHYMFSERQRIALARSVCTHKEQEERKQKEINLSALCGTEVHIDGFNTIITLEVALSRSLVLSCRDGCIRDLAGLRGTYHIIEVTRKAIQQILDTLEQAQVAKAVWYLDAPVSNSGRLKQLIYEMSEGSTIKVHVEVIPDVDRTLEQLSHVITTDAIIIGRCKNWINLNKEILKQELDPLWIVTL